MADAINSITQPPRGQNIMRNIVLPLASVLETIATAKASKGHFVGNAAQQAIKSIDERRRQAIADAASAEDRDLNRRYKEAQISQLGKPDVYDPTKELKRREAEAKLKKAEQFKKRAQDLQRPFTQDEQFQFDAGLYEDLIKGRKGVKDKPVFTDKEKFEAENKLRDKFDAISKPFRTIRDSYSRMLEAVKDPTGPGDLALIFSYMKVLDPDSSVREGEFANAENSVNVPEKLRGLYNRIVSGEGRLSEKARALYLNKAGDLYKSQAIIQQRQIDRYKNISERNGLNWENIIDPIILQPAEKLKVEGLSDKYEVVE